MHNHEIYLGKVETYLQDLQVSERIKLLVKIQDDIKDTPDSELQEALTLTNIKRGELGFSAYSEIKKFSLFRLFLKLSAMLTALFIITASVLIYKFSPILKIDEKNNRVIILGGLIDIDGKAGKFKIMDDYHFTPDKFTNELQASINMDVDKDEIIIEFESGTFELNNSDDSEFRIDCKLAKPGSKNVINQQEDLIKLNFNESGGSNCKLFIPENKKLTLEGEDTSIIVNRAEFNIYIEIKNGRVAITPEAEIDYNYNLEVKSGYIGEFETNDTEDAYEIQISIENGAIIRK